MPHSSGGGSSSGGSHSGSSGGGSHSSSGSSNVGIRKKYFRGCRTYVYYRNHEPHYVYSDTPINGFNKEGIAPAIILGIFVMIFIVLVCIFLFEKPRKLDVETDYRIVLSDKANVLDNTTELKERLKEFKELTGITPAIFTVYDSYWSSYNSLERYAYDEYIKNFNDETHWLFVYSVSDDPNNHEWSWEAMQGDDTDPILTSSKCEFYIEIIQNNLMNDSFTETEAFNESFKEINTTVMSRPAVDMSGLIFLVIFTTPWILIIIVLLFPCAFKRYRAKNLSLVSKKVDPTTGKPKERTCEYCGGVYVKDLHKTCPHCGAAPIDDDFEDNLDVAI